MLNFTVCVTPFNYHYNNIFQFVEMIEVNRMFGAQRFVFYNYSTGVDILPYIQSYVDEGIVEVIPWHVPVPVNTWPPDPKVVPEIHYFGQVAALNDCLYRNLFRSRFIVFTDLDEILVPRGGNMTTWADLLDTAVRKFKKADHNVDKFPGSFLVRNTFFRSDWRKNDSRMDDKKTVHDLQLKTLITTEREDKIHDWYMRSKYIAWTKTVKMVGVHSVSEFMDNSRVTSVNVDSDDGLLHHYRPTMWEDDPIDPPKRVHDAYMHRFYDTILNATLDRHWKVRERARSNVKIESHKLKQS